MKISSLQKGLVGHSTMAQDSLKGSLLADKTPYENDGTIYGATFATDRKGKANSAMSFDGVNDYIDCGNDESLDFGTSDFTIYLWAKKYENIFKQYQVLLSKGTYKNYGEWHFEKYSGYSSFYWPNTSDTLLLYKKMNERYFLKKNKKIIDVTIDVYFDNDSCFHPLFRELEEVILKETKRQKQLLEARKNIDRIW